jgi:transposase
MFPPFSAAATAGFSNPDGSIRSRRRRYPSDLTDGQWARLSPLIVPTCCPRSHRLRDIVDALNYRWETGCSWRMLPHDLPRWRTVYGYFRLWERLGLMRPIHEIALHKTAAAPKRGDGTSFIVRTPRPGS